MPPFACPRRQQWTRVPSEGQGASGETTPGVSREACGRHSHQATPVAWRGLAASTAHGVALSRQDVTSGVEEPLAQTAQQWLHPVSLASKASRVPVVEAKPLGSPAAEQGLVMRKAGQGTAGASGLVAGI